jgi:hypothetical protein
MNIGRHDVYICNSCGLLREGSQVPTGWIGIVKHAVGRPFGLGFYCSAECLDQKVKILVKAERNHSAAGEAR